MVERRRARRASRVRCLATLACVLVARGMDVARAETFDRESSSIVGRSSERRARRRETTETPTRETWSDAVDDASRACASSEDRARCLTRALRERMEDAPRDAPGATCAAREATRRAMTTPNEGASGVPETLLVTCASVAREIGRDCSETRACGEWAEAICDGGCVKGVAERAVEGEDARETGGSAGDLVKKLLEDGCERGSSAYDACARASGWAATRARDARQTRDAREACAAANGTSGARSCRFGVVEAYVEERLKEMRGGDPGEMCRSSDLAGSPADARVSDECARTLGSVFMAMYQYDDVKSRERCDLIAEDSFKRLCVASVDEEKTRRDIDLRAAVPFCTRALAEKVGENDPLTPSPPPPSPSPPGTNTQDAAEHRKEALRRHGTAVGGALWLTMFLILLTVVLGVTAYLWWRDGGTFGPRPTVEYSRVVSAEMASL